MEWEAPFYQFGGKGLLGHPGPWRHPPVTPWINTHRRMRSYTPTRLELHADKRALDISQGQFTTPRYIGGISPGNTVNVADQWCTTCGPWPVFQWSLQQPDARLFINSQIRERRTTTRKRSSPLIFPSLFPLAGNFCEFQERWSLSLSAPTQNIYIIYSSLGLKRRKWICRNVRNLVNIYDWKRMITVCWWVSE